MWPKRLSINTNIPVKERGNWANKTEFLLSCLGYAIGIGNVWRFPYLCYRNGGGAFLIPYLLMLIFCGIPLFFMETSLGQFANTGCLTIFRISPLFKGAGYAIIVLNFIACSYYTVIIAYPVLFLVYSFGSQLPWFNCDNDWNTPNCLQLSGNGRNLTGLFTGSERSVYKTPADEFFHNKILQISSSPNEMGDIVWPLFASIIFVWITVYLCIMKGVKTVGKVVYFTATFPFIILLVLFIRGVTLPGALDGIKFYLYPEWSQLTNLKVWSDAAIQIFYSLGPGWGGIIHMASYNEFRNNNKRDSILVPILNCGTSIFAGFVVFSVLGFMAHKTGLPVSMVATGGPGLAFVTYPEAITMLPWPQLWAILFFAMLFFLGLDSFFVQIEAIISSIIDELPQLRRHKTLVSLSACLIMFLSSILFVCNGGMYYLQLFDWYAASISVILVCLVEVFIVGWIYGVVNFVRDLEFMISDKLHWWWPLCWKYITPIILLFIFITTLMFNRRISYNGVDYSNCWILVGWTSCFSSIICIPIAIIKKLLEQKGRLSKRIRNCLQATNDWGPSHEEDKIDWLNHINQCKVY